MSEQPSIQNELSGNVGGHVVQAGAIHGGVVFQSSVAPLSQESAELQRRLEARLRRTLDSEDTQRAHAQARLASYLRTARVKRRANAVVLIIFAVAAVLWSSHIWRSQATLWTLLIAFFVGPFSVLGWVQYTLILRKARAGRPVRVPESRLLW